MTVATTSRTLARWGAKHGMARAAVALAARRGDVQARLFTDPEVRRDPYALYDEVRARGRLVDGRLSRITAHHGVASAVLRNDRFAAGIALGRGGLLGRLTAYGAVGAPIGPVDPPSMLVVDPPVHTRYRRLVSGVFTARAIAALRPRIEERCAELLDGMAVDGTVDLVERYASLLPVTVIAEILGVPLAMRDRFLEWGAAAAPTLDLGLSFGRFRRTEAAIGEGNRWMLGHLERLRREPGDDLLSRLVHADDGGERLTDQELMATAGLLLAAGFETTVNLLGSGVVLLLRHPDQLALLRDDPSRWGGAVEEVLRFESPVQSTARTCVADTEVTGIPVRAGQVVATLLGGCNRDPAVFEDPHRFDVLRPNAREHLSFGGGPHFCLGAALARLEGEVGLRALFDRHPDLRLAAAPHRRPTRVLRGYDAIPVHLGTRSGADASAR